MCRAREPVVEEFRMTVARVKELAGKYALCQPVGPVLAPVSAAFEPLEVANEAWRECKDTRLAVACYNRLDR